MAEDLWLMTKEGQPGPGQQDHGSRFMALAHGQGSMPGPALAVSPEPQALAIKHESSTKHQASSIKHQASSYQAIRLLGYEAIMLFCNSAIRLFGYQAIKLLRY